MAEQTEAGHVRNGMNAGDVRQSGPERIELGGRGDQGRIPDLVEPPLLECGAEHADAEGLGQDQNIARLGRPVGQHLVGMNKPEGDEAVDRFDAVDGMTARDRDAGGGADGRAAFENPADRFDREGVDRHADDGQGEDRRRPHGIDVRQGIGRGDAAEVERVVDHRHEEVGGGDQRLGVVQPPDGGVVGGFGPDHQCGEGRGLGHPRQDGLKSVRRDLATAAASVRERCQPGCVRSHAWALSRPELFVNHAVRRPTSPTPGRDRFGPRPVGGKGREGRRPSARINGLVTRRKAGEG